MPKHDSNCKSKCTRGLCSISWWCSNIIFLVVFGFDSSCLVVVKVNHILCNTFKEWFQASAVMWIKSAFFCDFTRRKLVVIYRRFGTTYRSHLQGSSSSFGPLKFEAPRFQENWHMKVEMLSAVRSGRLNPQEIFSILVSAESLSRLQGQSVAGRIK